jgi:hypothetical protein
MATHKYWQAWQDLQRGDSLQAGQIVFAANTGRRLEQAYGNSLVGHELNTQYLATLKVWSELSRDSKVLMSKVFKSASVDDGKLPADTVAEAKAATKRARSYINVVSLLWTPVVASTMQSTHTWDTRNLLYVTMHKPIHGQPMSDEQKRLANSLVKWYNRGLEGVKKFKLSFNVQLDYCLSHIISGGKGCRAGINMFNIHADGAITGCPYSAEPKAFLQDYDNIGEAIRYVRQLANSGEDYDWDKCSLRI